jgi:hypothetical protein
MSYRRFVSANKSLLTEKLKIQTGGEAAQPDGKINLLFIDFICS